MPPAPQQSPHRQVDFAREIVSLIESALQQTNGMQGHGNHGISALEQIQPAAAHQAGQRLRQLAPAFELEGMEQLAQRAFVRRGTSRHGECRRPSRATPAEGRCVQALRQSIAASLAEGRANQADTVPAVVADRSIEWAHERPAASWTHRVEEQANQVV